MGDSLTAANLRALEARLRASEARNEAILKASLDAIIVMDHEGRVVEFNPAAETILGFSRAEVIGKPLADHIIPERLREQHRRGLARYLERREGPVVNRRVELPALRASGEEFPAELAIIPVAGSEPPLFAGFLRDITDRKRGEERQRVLMHELAHRSRNLLAVVQSIAAHTFTNERRLEESHRVFSRRLEALARAHLALTPAESGGGELGDLIRRECEGFSDRVEAQGPALTIHARAAQTFALLVHELATNAVKYGALSGPSGRVAVSWEVTGAGGAARFRFQWCETGGPRVEAPARTGFGRIVLEKVVAQDLGGAAQIEFAPQGLCYSVEAPLAALTNGG